MDRPEDAKDPGPDEEKGYSGRIPATKRAWRELFFVGVAAGAVLFTAVVVVTLLWRVLLPLF